MKVVILAGGFGSRLQEETSVRPKPMVEIGGKPILWHIMKIYAAAGFKEFVVALGYKGEVIKEYFLNYPLLQKNLTVNVATGQVKSHNTESTEDWIVHLVDTGHDTMTGGRLKCLAPWIGQEPFLMTYGDGVSSVDLPSLIAFHRKQGKLATVTAVRPPSRFGGLSIKEDRVVEFIEKPQIGEGWINGGFFIMEPKVLDYIDGPAIVFEKEPMERLAKADQLAAYRHEGFWQCMDTVREHKLLQSLWEQASCPWKTWT